MTRFILFAGILLMFFSCSFFDGCEKLSFSESDEEWFDFDLNREFIYKSSFGGIDTFNVSKKINYYSDCNKLEISLFQYENYELHLTPNGDSCESDEDIQLLFEKRSDSAVSMCFYVFDLFCCTDTLQSSTLNCISGINGESTEYKTIESFIWKKDSGLVQFTKRTGEIYNLVN